LSGFSTLPRRFSADAAFHSLRGLRLARPVRNRNKTARNKSQAQRNKNQTGRNKNKAGATKTKCLFLRFQ
jgi:hypothetical protein